MDLLPPHSFEAEQATIGCLILNPDWAIPEFFDHASVDVFYDKRNSIIAESIREIHDQGKRVDHVTLSEALKSKGSLDQIGGTSYLASLPDFSPSAYNLLSYVEILLEKWKQRKLLQSAYRIIESVKGGESPDEIINGSLTELSMMEKNQDEEIGMTKLANEAVSHYQKAYEGQEGFLGVSTGFIDLDQMILGLKPGEVFIIGGRPSLGKTSLGLNIAMNMSHALHVVVFSAEMNRESLARRVICSEARINERDIYKSNLSEHEIVKLVHTGDKVKKTNLSIFNANGYTISKLRSKARRVNQSKQIGAIVIDYLQLLVPVMKSKSDTRNNIIGDVSKGVKNLAVELNVPVILLCQLNRELDKERNRKPRLSDLRDSGEIEQDGDIIGLLHRDFPEGEEIDSDTVSVNLFIAKQRNGPTGDVSFTFHKKYTRYESRNRV